MTPSQQAALEALAGRALTAGELSMAEERRDGDLAASLSAGRTELIETRVNEVGVNAILGLIEGENVLASFDAFQTGSLPAAHPLKRAEAGAKRMLGYLKKAQGLDLGNMQTQQMLACFSNPALFALPPAATEENPNPVGAPGWISPANAAKLKAAAQVPAPIAVDAVSAILNLVEGSDG